MSSVEAQAQDLGEQVRQALARRDVAGALRLLAAAEAEAPGDLGVRLQKAMVRRAAGDLKGSLEALEEALDIDPYDFTAVLSKAAVIEKMEGARAAVPHYRNAVRIAPPDDVMPAQLRAPTERARQMVAQATDDLAAYLRERTAALGAECSEAARRRFDEAVAIHAGKATPYTQEPLLLHYPRLPAIPFYDRGLFPWLEELEAGTEMMRAELETALKVAWDDEFVPYIAAPKGVPINQWGELNHSRRWSSLFLWKDGVKHERACQLCPGTTELLSRLPLAEQPNFAPTAMFSALEAHTHIPPHTGSTNVRLLTHLPLILPGPARFRVGSETREWRMGEAWVFDDTINHEAWNDADELRVIFIFDIWNPFIEEGERALICTLLNARNDFYASV